MRQSSYILLTTKKQDKVQSVLGFLKDVIDDKLARKKDDENTLPQLAAVIESLNKEASRMINAQKPAPAKMRKEVDMTVTYGNDWRRVKPLQRALKGTRWANRWIWQFFAEISPLDIWESAVLELDPETFDSPEIPFKPPEEVIRYSVPGDGPFTLKFRITLKDDWVFKEKRNKTSTLKWLLVLDGDKTRAQTTAILKIEEK
jgi:hypothetical protein